MLKSCFVLLFKDNFRRIVSKQAVAGKFNVHGMYRKVCFESEILLAVYAFIIIDFRCL